MTGSIPVSPYFFSSASTASTFAMTCDISARTSSTRGFGAASSESLCTGGTGAAASAGSASATGLTSSSCGSAYSIAGEGTSVGCATAESGVSSRWSSSLLLSSSCGTPAKGFTTGSAWPKLADVSAAFPSAAGTSLPLIMSSWAFNSAACSALGTAADICGVAGIAL
ncbi:hypothetical protein C8Q72DRAFT_128726 [Fomitopsis betulina]|nr:hypothetical protein C8Q72DRAFT_128726 [Fomitopsis betulina]